MAYAFLFFGTDFSSSRVFESVAKHSRCAVLTQSECRTMPLRVRNLFEMQDPFLMDVSGCSYGDVQHFCEMFQEQGYWSKVYVQQGSMRHQLSEASIACMTTIGLFQTMLPAQVVMLESSGHTVRMVRDILRLLGEEGSTIAPPPVKAAGTPKVPTEVDRLKIQQKQDDMMNKQRQAMELMQAKQRELAQKSREEMNKISSKAQGA